MKPRHRGVRGVEWLTVGKMRSETEAFAWWMTAAKFRAREDGSVLEDTASLAKVAGISERGAQRCLREALGKGLVSRHRGRLVLDREACEHRHQALKKAGCQLVKVYAGHLQDQDLSPLDRRILGWAEWKGRGVQRKGGRFVLSREAIARELGIGTRTLNKHFSALGNRVEQRWTTCADGRQRLTIWVADRRQKCASETTEVPIGRGPLSATEVRTTENHPRTPPATEVRTTENPELETYLSTPADPPEVSTMEASSQRVDTGAEPRAGSLQAGPGAQSLAGIRTVVESFRLTHDELDPASVALMFEELGCNRPDDLDEGTPQRQQARRRGLVQELLHLAHQACKWASTVDDLCCFILRVAKEVGPRNLPAYLRECFQQGDPGCLLRSQKKNQVGRAAETWRDYSAKTERALEGPYAADCGKVVAGLALGASEDGERRVQLRLELARMLALGRQGAARWVLLELVPKPEEKSDLEIARALRGVMPVESARALLEAA